MPKPRPTSKSVRSRSHLSHLQEKNMLSPDEMVKSAKDPKNPLHKYFEWDPSKAARKYREYQAREILRKGIKDGS